MPNTLEKLDRAAFATNGGPSIVNIYYKGSKSEWNNVNIYSMYSDEKELFVYFDTQINVYCYSDAEPIEKNAYWHYNSNNEIEIWK